MSKTAKFDRQEVINKATNLYWKNGFHATSMRHLQEEVDMRPGSIYAAFGNKDGLFKETLKNYTDMGLAQIANSRRNTKSPIAALKNFVKSVVIESQKTAPNGMCMLAKTIAELTDEHEELIQVTKGYLREIECALKNLIEEAQSQGEINQDTDPSYLASHVQIQIAGLRFYAKTNNDKGKLESMIDEMFKHYPF